MPIHSKKILWARGGYLRLAAANERPEKVGGGSQVLG
jgi:hypothetical protein